VIAHAPLEGNNALNGRRVVATLYANYLTFFLANLYKITSAIRPAKPTMVIPNITNPSIVTAVTSSVEYELLNAMLNHPVSVVSKSLSHNEKEGVLLLPNVVSIT